LLFIRVQSVGQIYDSALGNTDRVIHCFPFFYLD
jgi:hypothetical protein